MHLVDAVQHHRALRDRQPPGAQRVRTPATGAPGRTPRACRSRGRSAAGCRDAVIRGSFCRSEPAAVLRGFANGGLPASTIERVERLEVARGGSTPRRAPRPASGTGNSGVPVSRSGTSSSVRMLSVMSSPVRPSPRVSAAGEHAVLVEQVHREPVDLQLAEVVQLLRADVARHPLGPGPQLVGGEGVVQAEHALEVVVRGELAWRTCRRPSAWANPASTSSGCSSSSSSSSRHSASNWPSETIGASST